MSEISTICANCISAIYDGNTQVGCKFNRLEKFANNGAVVSLTTMTPEGVDATDTEITKDLLKFFHIAGRYCSRCRDKESMGDSPESEWDAKIVLFSETRIDAVVYFDMTSTIDGLRTTLESIARQSLAPQTITVVAHDTNISDVEFFSAKPRGINVVLTRIIAQMTHAGALREGMYRAAGNYIAICDAGHRYGQGDFRRLDRTINDECKIVPFQEVHGALFVARSLLAHPAISYDLETLQKVLNGEVEESDGDHTGS